MVIADYREPIAIQNDFHPAPIRTILSFVFSENIAKSSLEFRCNMHLSLVLEVFRRDGFEVTILKKACLVFYDFLLTKSAFKICLK